MGRTTGSSTWRWGHSRNLLVNSFTFIFNFQVGCLVQDAKNIWLIYAFLCQQNKDDADVGLLQWVQQSISSAGDWGGRLTLDPQ